MLDWKSIALGFVLCMMFISAIIAITFFVDWCQDLAFKRKIKREDKKRKKDKLNQAKEIIQALYYCLKNYDKTVLCGELINAIAKAEAFLKDKEL